MLINFLVIAIVTFPNFVRGCACRTPKSPFAIPKRAHFWDPSPFSAEKPPNLGHIGCFFFGKITPVYWVHPRYIFGTDSSTSKSPSQAWSITSNHPMTSIVYVNGFLAALHLTFTLCHLHCRIINLNHIAFGDLCLAMIPGDDPIHDVINNISLAPDFNQ